MPTILRKNFAPRYALFAVLLLSTPGDAADSPDPAESKIEPQVTGIGVRLPLKSERFIAIHRQARDASTEGDITYFHRPLLIFEERKSGTGPSAFPKIVHAVSQREDATFLEFRTILSTPDVREQVRGLVIQADADARHPGSGVGAPNRIRPDRWPISYMTVDVRDRLTKTLLARQWTSGNLETVGDIVRFDVEFDDAGLRKFLELLGHNQVEFLFRYSFRNLRQEFAVASISASSRLNTTIDNVFASRNITSDTVLFQAQANELRRELSTQINSTIVASAESLVPLVQTQLIDKYLVQSTIDIDKIQDSKLQDAIYEYIRPLIQKAQSKRTEQNTETEVDEDGIAVSLKGKGPGGDFEINKSDKDAITKAHSVTFEETKDGQQYRPRFIKVYKVGKVQDDATLDVVTRAFIAQSGTAKMMDDTPIPAHFTDVYVGEATVGQLQAVSPFAGLQPGMAFCFLGQEVPRGYVELDGKAVWPHHQWVPEQLRGRNMPDARGHLVGIGESGQFGKVTEPGSLKIPEKVIDGSSFKVKESNGGYVASDSWARFNGNNAELNGADQVAKPVNEGKVMFDMSNMQWFLKPTHQTFYGPEIVGQSKIDSQEFLVTMQMSPPYFKCRWIVRID